MRTILLATMLGASVNSLSGQQMPVVFVPGGPTNVRVLFQDHLGRLWVGGGGDVAWFDGSHFFSLRAFGFPETAGVGAITEDANGAIWIGSDTALYRFYQGVLKRVIEGYVTAIAASSGVVAASLGPAGQALPQEPLLYRIQTSKEGWKSERIMQLPNFVPFTLDHTGTLLISYPRGWGETRLRDIAQWRRGSQLPITKHGLPRGAVGDLRYLRDHLSCVWSHSEIATLYQCPGEPEPTSIPGFLAAGVLGMSEASDGTMVFANDSSLVIGRPEKFRAISRAQGLPNAGIAIMAEDGTVWMGGRSGLYRLPAPFRLEYWTARDGVEPGYAICRNGGKVLAGTMAGGLAVLSDDRARWNGLPLTRPLGEVLHLLPRRQGGMVVGTRGYIVAEIRADGTTEARTTQGGATRLVHTPDGQLWASGGQGVRRITRSGDLLVDHLESLPGNPSISLDMEYEARTAKLWACSNAGLMSREAYTWRAITTKDGLLENACTSLAALPSGDVWLGYEDHPAFALVRPNPSGGVTVRQFQQPGPSRAGDNVHFLDIDSRGWLWRGTGNGVYVATPSDAENNLWIHLSDLDGLTGLDTAQQSFYADPSDGSVWWSSSDAIEHFSPQDDFVRPAFAPKVFVSAFSWSGATKLADGASEVPHGEDITALVGSLQFDRRNAMRFRYRLTPDQPTWRDTRSFDIALGKLPWGSHKLELQAKLVNGPWSAIQSEVFEIAKPFWVTWPFLLALAGVTLSGGAVGYRWHIKQRERASKAFPNLKEWRLAAFSPEVQGLLGQVLDGRYRLQRVIARGGFATVLDGEDLQAGNRPCAVKVFRRELSDKDWLRRHFEREVSALEQVRHVNVVEIYSHGVTPEGSPYLAMEFIEGRTLREVLNAGPLSAPHAASLLRQAGAALEAIHACGICHRDVKPENVMIRAAGPIAASLVVIDFSIAIVRRPDETIHGLSRAAGTIYYMAPEQAIGYADVTTDIYSLAKVLLEMLTGARLSDLLPDASMDLPNRVRELLAGLAVRLGTPSIELIASALEFDPARRPRNVREFAEVIAGDLDRGI